MFWDIWRIVADIWLALTIVLFAIFGATLPDWPCVRFTKYKRLMVALQKDDLQEVKRLLDKGVNPNAHKGLALTEAIYFNNLGAAQLLLDYGADINIQNGLALTRTAKLMNEEKLNTVKFLLEHGADVHVQDEQALIYAVENKNTHLARILLEYGANVHARGDLAIAKAVKSGNIEMVRLLLNYGANPHAAGSLTEYYTLNNPEIAELLSQY